MNRLLPIIVLFLAVNVTFGEEVKIQYRMTGLFQPDRVDDLRRQAGTITFKDTDVPAEVKLTDVNYDLAIVTYAYDPASKQFKDKKPEQVQERVNDHLRNVSRGSFSISPLSKLKPDQQKQERIPVGGLDCKGCAYGAYRVIANIDGVERAVVSFKDGHVTAWIDPVKTNREALVKALKQAEVDVTDPDAAAKKTENK